MLIPLAQRLMSKVKPGARCWRRPKPFGVCNCLFVNFSGTGLTFHRPPSIMEKIYIKEEIMETVKGTVNLRWTGARMMLGTDSRGAAIPIGYNREADPPWNAVKPSDLLLLAAASCSAYDVVEILEKQREPLLGLDVQCTGEQITAQPYNFITVHLKYIVKGPVTPQKVERAIQLSEEKYCSVLATLRAGVELSSEYEIIE
ncbi:MAG TPA: hypothetical protein DEH25_11045 [Chloroflexi bacterium]|nr:hypothetical protein [Chloroflexota bacterium]